MGMGQITPPGYGPLVKSSLVPENQGTHFGPIPIFDNHRQMDDFRGTIHAVDGCKIHFAPPTKTLE